MKQAYYHICQECSREHGVCGKCGKTAVTEQTLDKAECARTDELQLSDDEENS